MEYCDQISRTVNIPEYPSRIISLVPSVTELLSDLELDNNITGITKFCVQPNHIFKSKTRIGGTKKINIDKIRELNPDLIIANKEENTHSDIHLLEFEFPVWVSDVNTYSDALSMINEIGIITGKIQQANNIVERINKNFRTLQKVSGISVLYLIWKKPYMAAGCGTFIDDMLSMSGYNNVLKNMTRYPELNNELIKSLNPDVILLSSEPYPFRKKDMEEIEQLFPNANVFLANGEFFSWYGSRMIKAPAYFNQLNSYIFNTIQSV